MAVTEITRARKCGNIRFHAIYEYPVDLDRILLMCCLKPMADKLLEVGREDAVGVLRCWLHREAAYQSELMNFEAAQELAENFVREFADETSSFFTNGRWFDLEHPKNWQPLTDSVFDGGILIESGKGNNTRHICLWFEDED